MMFESLFSIFDVLIAVLFAFIFVVVFRIQKLRYPVYYFGFGELVYGFKTSISLIAFLLKFLIILIFGFVVSLAFSSLFVTIFSASFGAFLIVWPAILNPSIVDSRLEEKRKLAFLFYVVFVIASGLIALFGYLVASFIRPTILEYGKSFLRNNRIVFLVIDTVIVALVLWLGKRLLKLADRRIKLHQAEIERLQGVSDEEEQ